MFRGIINNVNYWINSFKEKGPKHNQEVDAPFTLNLAKPSKSPQAFIIFTYEPTLQNRDSDISSIQNKIRLIETSFCYCIKVASFSLTLTLQLDSHGRTLYLRHIHLNM